MTEKITRIDMQRTKNRMNIFVYRGTSGDRMGIYHADSPTRARRLMNVFVAWLVRCGERM